MRITIFLFTVILSGFKTTAQDLIVTTANDSINARITKENKKGVYFDFMKNGELRSTLLLRSQIAHFKKDFFETPEVPKNAKKVTDYDGNRWRISANTGFAYRFGKIAGDVDPVVRDYLRELKSGFHWGANAHYFINEQYAIGAKLSAFHSSKSSNDIQTVYENGTVEQGVSDDIRIVFMGPSFLSRFLSVNGKNAFLSNLALGYINYTNSQRLGSRSIMTSGSNIGLTTELGYDIGLSETVSLGISTTGMIGGVNKLQVTENESTQTIDLKEIGSKPESLTAYNLSVDLRLNL